MQRLMTVGLALIMVTSISASLPPSAEVSAQTPGAAATFIVVLKSGAEGAGLKAIQRAGGTVIQSNKVGVASVRSGSASFADELRASGVVEAVGPNAAWKFSGPLVPTEQIQFPGALPVPTAAAGCAAQFNPPGGTGVGPDPLSVCQWDMRIINASPPGSYAVNQGLGAKVGILDTGIDAFHADIIPNLDMAHSCSFIKPGNPTALAQEIAPTGRACGLAEVLRWQDYNGHGTHVGGTVAAPINGQGVAGVAPRATLVALKVCTGMGFCFTQEVVDALIEAGDQRLDVVNMSFFADPFLYNCHGSQQQQTIIKAISRAAQYAASRGVVLVAAAGNELHDLDHPPDQDLISPDFPADAAVPRDISNNCVVLPQELPNVATISAIGPEKVLAFYSSVSHSKVDVAAPGGSSTQATNPYGRVLNAWSSSGNPDDAEFFASVNRLVEDCQGPGGTPPCYQYVWIQGTSMASPHAAGVAALIRARHRGMPPLAVIALLQNTAMPMSCGSPPANFFLPAIFGPTPRCTGGAGAGGGETNWYGNGLVDAFAAGTR